MSDQNNEQWQFVRIAGQEKWAIGPSASRRAADAYSEERARRLVACWNACIGIRTELLESAKDWADAVIATAVTQRDVIARLQEENANLRTVMIAAAEEINEHWEAHCDAEGYGPVNLQRRLEAGMPAEYGYTAGAFARLHAQRDELLAALQKYVDHFGDPLQCARAAIASASA